MASSPSARILDAAKIAHHFLNNMIYKDEVYKIIGSAFEVYNVLGSGFLEPVYQEAMEIELGLQDIPFSAQAQVPIYYKYKKLNKEYYADLICYDAIIVELKAVENLNSMHQAQLLNYLHAVKMPVGLLINFGHERNIEWKRIVL